MPRGTHSIEINASCDAVFELIHNYDIRLQWDSMLCEATLLGAAAEVVKGVRTRCVGNWKCLWLAIEADYLSYEKGKVAAVKMSNKPMFFAEFAATIRHDDLKNGRSKVTYIFNFDAKPRYLTFLLEPVMKFCLKREVTHRLAALKRFAENRCGV